jgi:HD-like signal output (HDOD) protein
MDKTLRGKIERYINDMPSLPTTMSKVLEVCNNPQISPSDLNRVISIDPVLVGRMLKLVNSAYYGMGQKVTSTVRAIIMLGINTVKNLALSSAIMDSFNFGFRGLDAEAYWLHSLCVGMAAKLIARKRGIDSKLLEEYFAAGLLHDIGKIPLSAALPRDYMKAAKDADFRIVPLFQGETAILGVNHAEAGGLVIKAWRMGGAVMDAVVYHHNYAEYPGEHKDLLYSVVVANYFASRMEIGFSGNRHPRKPEDMVWETLEIAWEDIENIKPIVDTEIEKVRLFLNL